MLIRRKIPMFLSARNTFMGPKMNIFRVIGHIYLKVPVSRFPAKKPDFALSDFGKLLDPS